MGRGDGTVGFFDSGVGGETILRAFRRLCPDAPTRYLADTAHCPYGPKPLADIRARAEAMTRRLLDAGCSVVVVACNSATAAAIDDLRAAFPAVPFVGVEPALKPACLRTKTGTVAVLATEATFKGRLYRQTKARWARDVRVLETPCPEWVRLVEEAWAAHGPALWDDAAVRRRAGDAVRRRVEPLLAQGADALVLGCTHFPHLTPLLEPLAAGRAALIDNSAAVARQILKIWKEAFL